MRKTKERQNVAREGQGEQQRRSETETQNVYNGKRKAAGRKGRKGGREIERERERDEQRQMKGDTHALAYSLEARFGK